MTRHTLDFSKPHVLRDEGEYDVAVAELDMLLDRGKLSREEEDRLEFLTLLVEEYDRQHYPVTGATTPQSVLDFMLEQNDMTRSDLAPLMGGRSRVSDFFNGYRTLSLGQIRKVRERFNIAADVLINSEQTASEPIHVVSGGTKARGREKKGRSSRNRKRV